MFVLYQGMEVNLLLSVLHFGLLLVVLLCSTIRMFVV
jgi:hypothetical protein